MEVCERGDFENWDAAQVTNSHALPCLFLLWIYIIQEWHWDMSKIRTTHICFSTLYSFLYFEMQDTSVFSIKYMGPQGS